MIHPQSTHRRESTPRPVRLVTISGKGGWDEDPALAQRWARNDNISLLDHLLSVARGALMFWLADAPRPWSNEADLAEIEQRAHAVVCIAFLHDIDKDLKLPRGTPITVEAVAERMSRYGIGAFLAKHQLRMSPAAMLIYIEEVEGTQAGSSPAAADYDRRIAATSRYVELADKLEGIFNCARDRWERWRAEQANANGCGGGEPVSERSRAMARAREGLSPAAMGDDRDP